MNKNISYDTLLDLLVGDLKTEESLAAVLNFLEHTTSMVRLLYLSKRLSQEKIESQFKK